MDSITVVSEATDVRDLCTSRQDLKTIVFWISLGSAAGGLGGLLVGGIGGRLAMLVLRLTSNDSVRESRATTGSASAASTCVHEDISNVV